MISRSFLVEGDQRGRLFGVRRGREFRGLLSPAEIGLKSFREDVIFGFPGMFGFDFDRGTAFVGGDKTWRQKPPVHFDRVLTFEEIGGVVLAEGL